MTWGYADWVGTVLVVEDRDDAYSVMQQVLEGFGMTLMRCHTLTSAVQILRLDEANSIGCVVLDLTLPDVDYDAAMRGESIEATRAERLMMPIVVVTGQSEIPPTVEAEAAQEWLLKPVMPLERVIYAVRSAVAYMAGAQDILDALERRAASTDAALQRICHPGGDDDECDDPTEHFTPGALVIEVDPTEHADD